MATRVTCLFGPIRFLCSLWSIYPLNLFWWSTEVWKWYKIHERKVNSLYDFYKVQWRELLDIRGNVTELPTILPSLPTSFTNKPGI